MTVRFVACAMSLARMAAISVVIFVKKMGWWLAVASRAIGNALVAAGVVLAFPALGMA